MSDFLTLDIQADDRATPQLRRTEASAEELRAEIIALVRASDALVQTSARLSRELSAEQRAARQAAAAKKAQVSAAEQAARAAEKERRAVERARREKEQAARASRAYATGMIALVGSAAAVQAALDAIGTSLRLVRDGFVASVKSSGELELELARVAAVTTDGAARYNDLKKAALDGGRATAFSSKEAAEGLRFLALAGFSADQQIAALPGTLSLASAGMVELGDAANITTNILTSYQFQAEQLGEVNDQLVATFTNSNTTLGDLGVTFKYVGSIARSAQQDFDGLLAVIGGLGNAGIPADKAGTTLRQTFTRLGNPKIQRELRKLGVEVKTSTGEFRQLIDVLADLEAKKTPMEDITRIFGQIAAPGVLALLGQGTTKLRALEQQIESSAGLAKRVEERVLNTFSGQLKILTGSLETTGALIGDEVTPSLTKLEKVLIKNLNAFSGNNKAIGEFGQIGRDLVSVSADLLDVTGDLVPEVFRLAGALVDMGKAAKTAYDILGGGLKAAVLDQLGPLGTMIRATTTTTDALDALGVGLRDSETSYGSAARAGDALGTQLKQAAKDTRDLRKELDKDAASKLGRDILGVTLRLAGFGAEVKKQEVNLAVLPGQIRAVSKEFLALARTKLPALGLAFEVPKKSDVKRVLTQAERERAAQLAHRSKVARAELELLNTQDKAAQIRQRAAIEELRLTGRKLTADERRLEITKIRRTEAKALAELEKASAERALSRERARLSLALAATTDKQQALRIELRQEQQLAALRAQSGLDNEERAYRQRLINLTAEREQLALIAAERSKRQDQTIALLRTEAAYLKAVGDEESQILAIVREREAALQDIRRGEGTTAQKSLDAQRVRLEAERAILAVRQAQRDQLIEQIRLLGEAAKAGVNTNVSRVVDAQFAQVGDRYEGALERLRSAQQEASDAGQDTTFLDRRIEALEREYELEQRNQELYRQRLELFTELGGATAELATQTAIAAAAAAGSKEAYEAQAAALTAAVGAGSALTSLLVQDAKKRAKIEALINAAAAVAAGAGFLTTGNPAFLAAAVQHGIASAKFALVAGSVGSGRPSIGATGSAGGATSAGLQTTRDPRVDQKALVDAFATALREQLAQPTQVTYNIDFGSSTHLRGAPDTARAIYDASRRAERSVYQASG